MIVFSAVSTPIALAVPPIFYVEDDTVDVVSLEALRSRPGYWRARLRGR